MPYTKKQLAAMKRAFSIRCTPSYSPVRNGDHYIITDGSFVVRTAEPLPEFMYSKRRDMSFADEYMRDDESKDHVLLENPVTADGLRALIAEWKAARKQHVTDPYPVVMLKSQEPWPNKAPYFAGFDARYVLSALEVPGPKASLYLGPSRSGHPSLLAYGSGENSGITVLVLPLSPKYWKEEA